jgi:hypothetical protein
MKDKLEQVHKTAIASQSNEIVLRKQLEGAVRRVFAG